MTKTVTWDREDTNSNWRILVNGEFHGRAGQVERMLIDMIEAMRPVHEPDWTDANGKRHRYKCGLNPDPAAVKHMVAHCTCPPDEPTCNHVDPLGGICPGCGKVIGHAEPVRHELWCEMNNPPGCTCGAECEALQSKSQQKRFEAQRPALRPLWTGGSRDTHAPSVRLIGCPHCGGRVDITAVRTSGD